MREGFLRILSCLLGVSCALLLPLPLNFRDDLYDLYNHVWNALAVGGWGALGCLFLSRLLYRGSWSSLQPGPPRGFSSSHQVADLLRTILGGFALISFLAVPMARNTYSVPFSLLSGFLALVLWLGLQRWEVSTATGVKVYRTFYGLQWLAREAHPAIHWETPTGPVGPRTDQQAFAARHRWAWRLALAVAVVVASLLVIRVAGNAGKWPVILAAAFYAPIPFYLLSYRLFYLIQPAGVSYVLGNTPQPGSRENPLLPSAKPADRRGCILALLVLPWAWLMVLMLLGLIALPSIFVAEAARINTLWLGISWVIWALVKLVEGRRRYLWHEVDLHDLTVREIEVHQGYQFAQPGGHTLKAVGVTAAPQGLSKFVPVLYFDTGDWLTVGDGEEQSWAWEIACRLAQKALVPAISPRTTVLTAEVSGWIRSGAQGKLTDWAPLKEPPAPVADEPPVD